MFRQQGLRPNEAHELMGKMTISTKMYNKEGNIAIARVHEDMVETLKQDEDPGKDFCEWYKVQFKHLYC